MSVLRFGREIGETDVAGLTFAVDIDHYRVADGIDRCAPMLGAPVGPWAAHPGAGRTQKVIVRDARLRGRDQAVGRRRRVLEENDLVVEALDRALSDDAVGRDLSGGQDAALIFVGLDRVARVSPVNAVDVEV